VPDGNGDDTVLDVLVETIVDDVELVDVGITEVEVDVEVGKAVVEVEEIVGAGGASPHLPYCG
jgi:Zn ribbon nucleic-acid-binding protein